MRRQSPPGVGTTSRSSVLVWGAGVAAGTGAAGDDAVARAVGVAAGCGIAAGGNALEAGDGAGSVVVEGLVPVAAGAVSGLEVTGVVVTAMAYFVSTLKQRF